MSGADDSNLQRLADAVACARTALDEIQRWHGVALHAIDDVQVALDRVDEEQRRRAAAATAAASERRATEAAKAVALDRALDEHRRRAAVAVEAAERRAAAAEAAERRAAETAAAARAMALDRAIEEQKMLAIAAAERRATEAAEKRTVTRKKESENQRSRRTLVAERQTRKTMMTEETITMEPPTARKRAATRATRAARADEPPVKRALAPSPGAGADAKKALLLAVEKGQAADVTHYLTTVDPNFYGDEGNTPLHLAAKHSRHAVVQILLENGADVRAPNHNQQTALHVAALANTKTTCCELLLRAAFDAGEEIVNVQDKTKRTALHYAALKGNAKAVELLLKYGADRSIKNIKGTTALDVATTSQVQKLLH